MSLQFVLGSSGAGKSHKIYTEIIKDSMENPKTNYIIIVPEQFTLQTQKNMVAMHPNKGILNIDVLSFVRLAYKIFSDIGYNPGVVLDDAGKNMILRKIVGFEEDKLVLFKGNVRKQGFISELKSLISELGQYSIKPDDLLAIEDKVEDGALKTKLSETQIVYSSFKNYLQDNYIMAEEVLDKLYNVLDKSDVLKDSVICFDGFTGFTPIQYKLLVKIMHLCKKVYVTTTIDLKEVGKKVSEFSLFGMSNTTITKVKDLARENGIDIDEDILVHDYIVENGKKIKVGRYKNSPAIEHVEQNVFRYTKSVYKGEQDDISIHALATPDEEVEYVINRIKNLVRKEGLRYRDIAVVTGDMENYGRIMDRKLEQNKLPYFIDNNKSIMDNPLVEMIRALFEVIVRDFSYESMFRFLRSGMLDYTNEQIDMLENYVIAYGKKRKYHWNKVWVAKDAFYTEERLEEINLYRKQIYDMLHDVSKAMKDGSTVKEISTGLYEFLVQNNSYDRIGRYEKYFEQNNMPTKAKEYSQVYDIVMDLLDKIVDLLGDEVVSPKEYLEIFEAGIEDVKIGVIPMTLDQLVVGDMERTRLNDIKVLFFIGVNEGIIPKNSTRGGIISELDRELLAKAGVELSPNKREELFIEQFYLYMNLTKASRHLCITYATVDAEGNAQKEAYIVGKLCELIEELEIKEEKLHPVEIISAEYVELPEDNEITSQVKDIMQKDRSQSLLDTSIYEQIIGNNKGIDYLAYGLRNKSIDDMSDEWKQLFAWYKDRVDGEDIVKNMLSEAFYANNESYIGKNVANMIYKNADKSVSEIEKYASCAYAHFLSYGLKLKNRKQYEIELPDIGTLFHGTLDMFSKQLTLDKKAWEDVTLEECERIIDRCVDEMASDYGGDILHSSKRYEYLIHRIKDITKRTVKTLQTHIKKGGFVPVGYEVRFDSTNKLDATNICLSDGDTIGLRGAIDRIDVADVLVTKRVEGFADESDEFSDVDDMAAVNTAQVDVDEVGISGEIIEEKQEYVKVIDYKSSGKKFEPALFLEGVQLQLMVYMSVALDTRKAQIKDREIRPAGVFYYTIDNPFVEKDEKVSISLSNVQSLATGEINNIQNANVESDNAQSQDQEFSSNENLMQKNNALSDMEDEIIEGNILKKLTMTGIVNADPIIVEQIDKDVVSNGMFIPKATSDVIKLSVATKGDLRKGTSALSDEGFDKLISKTKEIISEKVSDMKDGKIEKNPYKFGDKTPCEYCDYKGICNFDINLTDNNYKRISKKTMEDIIDTNNTDSEELDVENKDMTSV